MVKTYVKKPLPIEAIKFDGTNQQEICNWANANGKSNIWFDTKDGYMHAATLEGSFKAENRVGDYAVKGVKGEFYICEGSIFEECYEEVSK